jgi:hypothetical protein
LEKRNTIYTKTLLEIRNKSVTFLYSDNKKSEKEITKAMPFIIASKMN